jgi:small subunit ribosomal protein S16
MRMGKKKQPTYRVVAADSRSPRNGRFIEIVGIYEPRRDPSVIEIDNDKAVAWLKKGAQPTERVAKLLEVTGAWEQFKTGVAPAAPKPPPPAEEKATADEPAKASADEKATADEKAKAAEPVKPEADEGDEAQAATADDTETDGEDAS